MPIFSTPRAFDAEHSIVLPSFSPSFLDSRVSVIRQGVTIENWVEDESAMYNVGKNLLGDEARGMATATTQRMDYNPAVRGENTPQRAKEEKTRASPTASTTHPPFFCFF